jgi:hypothetical protein
MLARCLIQHSQQHPKDKAIQDVGVAPSLARLPCQALPQHAKAFPRMVALVVPNICRIVLASFLPNERIQGAACKALSHLSVDQESCMLIASHGGSLLIAKRNEYGQ